MAHVPLGGRISSHGTPSFVTQTRVTLISQALLLGFAEGTSEGCSVGDELGWFVKLKLDSITY